MSVIIGWDIGGAHLKAARVRDGRVEAVVQAATPLWLGLDSLETAFDALRAQLGDADHHAITMTGELVRRFSVATRGRRGSRRDRCQPSPASWTRASTRGRAGFVELGEAALHAADIASANWHASAALVALKLRDALFIDIGSTTADLIPIVAGRVASLGYSDAERLASGELVYTGMTRSFVMSLASRAPFRGAWTPLMNEYFASSADVHRILGDLPEGADKMPTADGREKTVEASRARLARMIGREADDADAPEWDGLAAWFAEAQIRADHRRGLRCGCPVTMLPIAAPGRRRWRRRRRRGRGRSPPPTALRRIFLADRGAGGSLALRARGRRCIACRAGARRRPA